MIRREREVLLSLAAKAVQQSKVDAEREREEKARRKKRREELIRLRREEVNFLRNSGVLATFKNARDILRKVWRDAQVKVENNLPENPDFATEITLSWDRWPIYDLNIQEKRVWCTVEREDKEGEIIGLSFYPSRKIIPTEEISQELVRRIQNPEKFIDSKPTLVQRLKTRFAG